jgi:phosphohistidine phosphatase
MQLILWRHAEAEDGAGKPDIERELTKRGRKQAERMAAWLETQLKEDWRILVSPATRPLQTVQPLEREFEQCEEVGLAATPDSVLHVAEWPRARRPVLVVGHQPTLGQVAARLLGGAEGEVSVRKGATWWFISRERDGELQTVLHAVTDPEQLKGD